MRTPLLTAGLLLALAGCKNAAPAGNSTANEQQASATAVPLQEALPAGMTPMNERVAVLGFLNKRNGIARDITLKPGQAIRIKDAIVRLRACETTPPWEFDKLTGAFVQLDVQQPGGGWKRVFSGWLYKESPSLNVVEHPVYDVWPKSCVMNFPDAAESAATPASSSNRSSARNSGAASRGGSGAAEGAAAPAPAEPAPAPEPLVDVPSAAPSNAT